MVNNDKRYYAFTPPELRRVDARWMADWKTPAETRKFSRAVRKSPAPLRSPSTFKPPKYLYSSRTDRFATIANMTPVQARSAGSKSGMKKVGAVLDVSKWNEMNTGIMRALIRIRITHDRRFRRLLKDARDHKIKLLHYEGGAEPYWGGYFKGSKKSLDAFYGKNMLGEIMMHASLSRWEDV